MLAVASKDVKIITLAPMGFDPNGHTKLELRQPAQFDEHTTQVWRVRWNVTGTVLASSGDDGCVRLWKANYMENWKGTAVLKGDSVPPAHPATSTTTPRSGQF
jgi:WD40 repeat protein